MISSKKTVTIVEKITFQELAKTKVESTLLMRVAEIDNSEVMILNKHNLSRRKC